MLKTFKKLIFHTVSILCCSVIFVYSLYHVSHVVYPISMDKITIKPEAKNMFVERLIEFFRVERKIAESIVKYSLVENVDPFLIASLFYTESKFNDKAVSPKNYKGISQIPAKWYTPYTDVNILIGIKVFKEKMRITDGDVAEAIRLYKGFPLTNLKYKREVQKVFDIYEQLTEQK